MTYQDIHSIQAFHEQIVIAVKAPEETRLDVPAPREVGSTVLPKGFPKGGRGLAAMSDHYSHVLPMCLSGYTPVSLAMSEVVLVTFSEMREPRTEREECFRSPHGDQQDQA